MGTSCHTRNAYVLDSGFTIAQESFLQNLDSRTNKAIESVSDYSVVYEVMLLWFWTESNSITTRKNNKRSKQYVDMPHPREITETGPRKET